VGHAPALISTYDIEQQYQQAAAAARINNKRVNK